MSAPFHFPTEYGKVGNWPGSLGPMEAQALLLEAMTHKPGAKFVELGFDGGRTTIALNWAARDLGAQIFCLPVGQDESGLWFKRASILFSMDREKVTAHEALAPFAADLIVMNPNQPVAQDWIDLAPVGASIVALGARKINATGAIKETLSQPFITIFKKIAEPTRAIDRAIATVVDHFSENKTARPLDNNQRAKIHSLRRDKKRSSDGNGTDTQVHEAVAANKGSELLPS